MPTFLASWQMVGRAAASSIKHLWPFTRDNIGLILAFFLPCEMLYHFFIFAQRMYVQAGFPPWPAAIGMILVTLLMMLFYFMLVPLRISEMVQNIPLAQRKPFWPFVFRFTWPLVLENVRAMAIVLLWYVGGCIVALMTALILEFMGLLDLESLTRSIQSGEQLSSLTPNVSLLILLLVLMAFGPGTYFYLRYYFVSFAVLCEPGYESGQVNPLKLSLERTKGFVFPFIVILGLFFWVDAFRNNLRETYPLMQSPLISLGVAFLFEFVAIYSNILLFEIYRLKTNMARAN